MPKMPRTVAKKQKNIKSPVNEPEGDVVSKPKNIYENIRDQKKYKDFEEDRPARNEVEEKPEPFDQGDPASEDEAKPVEETGNEEATPNPTDEQNDPTAEAV